MTGRMLVEEEEKWVMLTEMMKISLRPDLVLVPKVVHCIAIMN